MIVQRARTAHDPMAQATAADLVSRAMAGEDDPARKARIASAIIDFAARDLARYGGHIRAASRLSALAGQCGQAWEELRRRARRYG